MCWPNPVTEKSRDHPRLRGEHFGVPYARNGGPGSPPPARGALLLLFIAWHGLGITPACAGSIYSFPCAPAGRWDHPRLRGEHNLSSKVAVAVVGSPPPARGACYPGGDNSGRIGDHPRLRGEHISSEVVVATIAGSPPPARGACP